jgi:SPASM domain peptide maturase of grasp-with-spasm system
MYIKIFSCCTITKGSSRAAIVDIQREQIFFIPLSLYDLIDQQVYAINVLKTKQIIEEKHYPILDEYIEFLIDNELGFYCDSDELAIFPKMSEEWRFPAHITNCIIDSNGTIEFLNEQFFLQLEELCCNHIQLRFFSPVEQEDLNVVLTLINENQIKSLEIVLPINNYLRDEKNIVHFLEFNRKVKNLIITSADEYKILQPDDFSGTAVLTDKNITNNLHCGLVQLEQFSINVLHYTESLNSNTCLNRKIAIDTEGNIKNCPSMKESYGNIRDTTLKEALANPDFKKYWNITKDQITKCQDCEFRHICTDCRAFIDVPDDIYSAPLKCGYNPYTCEWEEWSTNPLKEKGISHYGLQELIKNQ